MKKQSLITIGIMLTVVVAAAAYVYFIDETEVQKRKNTPAAQAFIIEDLEKSFTDQKGEPVLLSEDIGEIVVATSWASWCPQCVQDLAKLGELASEYSDRGVVFLAINRAEDRSTAERFLKNVTVSPKLSIILDPSDHFFAANVGYAMPETILYDEKGSIVLHQRGTLQIDELRSSVNALLDE